MELLPDLSRPAAAGCLDAGCGVGRHLLPLLRRVPGLGGGPGCRGLEDPARQRLAAAPASAGRSLLAQADLKRLPFPAAAFDLVVSIKVINHGRAADFRDYCRELDRVLKPGGHLFINVSPRAFAER